METGSSVSLTIAAGTASLGPVSFRPPPPGKGRFKDNIFIERLWRTLKYERIYLKTYETGAELAKDLNYWFNWYNDHRRHSSLDKLTPNEAYSRGLEKLKAVA